MTDTLKNIVKSNKLLFWIFTKILLVKAQFKKIIVIFVKCIYYLFPVKKNKVIITNYYGKDYGDNGKYIVEEIKKQNLNYDIVWQLKKEFMKNNQLPNDVRAVEYGSLKSIYEQSTAKVDIDNCRKTGVVSIKKQNQIYINTMHSLLPLKQVEKDAEDTISPHYIKKAKLDSKRMDYIVSSCDLKTKIIQNSYWYDGKILEIGMPRIDLMMNQNLKIKKKVYQYLNINDRKKILLYTPTFRNNDSLACYDIDFDRLKKSLDNKFSNDWIILIRLHPNISKDNSKLKFNEYIMDATYYPDLQELMVASDVMITDYSSCMFEFSLTNKIVFLYATDVVNYMDERDFYIDLTKLPYPLSQNNDELIKNIEEFDYGSYPGHLIDFYDEIGISELGKSSQKLVGIINEYMKAQ
ncbi:MAG: CDP-glycerol glycerophosphotransferase family protein [Bacillota bacterium]